MKDDKNTKIQKSRTQMSLSVIFGLLFSAFLHLNAMSSIYIVPLDQTQLDPSLGLYEITDVQVIQSDKKAFLSFSLPKDLTGMQFNNMNFTGDINKDSNLELESVFGVAKCDSKTISSGVRCDITYNQSYKDLLELLNQNVESEIMSSSESQSLIDDRLSVWRSFSGDPLGAIIFE